MEDEYIKRLVITRLNAMPPNVSFSIGNYGDFTTKELIEQVAKGTNVGKATIEMELTFLREMPKIASRLSG